MLMASAPFFSQEDCDLFNIQELASENQELHDSIAQFSVDTILLQPDGSYEVLLSNGTTFMLVQGCTDPAYTEYSASANTDDSSCATLIVNGCTNPAYTEFDASANTDDGNCATQVAEGCTDPTDINYNAAANTDDGSCASYSCSSVEVDGYTYAVVEIGEQCWFAENLRTTVYADGEPIPGVTNPQTWLQLSSGGRCVYNNNGGNLATYGRLYNWYAVDDARGLCPSGWHVPTNQEWTDLDDYINSQDLVGTIGTALKSTTGWNNNGNGTDYFGFSALPGGGRYATIGYFMDAGSHGYWWSASGGYRWIKASGSIFQINYTGSNGYSVRCLRDAE